MSDIYPPASPLLTLTGKAKKGRHTLGGADFAPRKSSAGIASSAKRTSKSAGRPRSAGARLPTFTELRAPLSSSSPLHSVASNSSSPPSSPLASRSSLGRIAPSRSAMSIVTSGSTTPNLSYGISPSHSRHASIHSRQGSGQDQSHAHQVLADDLTRALLASNVSSHTRPAGGRSATTRLSWVGTTSSRFLGVVQEEEEGASEEDGRPKKRKRALQPSESSILTRDASMVSLPTALRSYRH